MSIDTRTLVSRLHLIESVAIIPRVRSTHEIGRKVVAECVENEIDLPSAVVVAREQLAGRGRGARSWSSPFEKGIYATFFLTCPAERLALLPLEIAVSLCNFLRDTFGVDARVKWPNDILVDGKKLAGVLAEARMRDSMAYVLIGIGVNVFPHGQENLANAVSLSEVTRHESLDLDQVTTAFIEHFDQALSKTSSPQSIIDSWRKLTVHQIGDAMLAVVGERSLNGTWGGIDDDGRALLRQGDQVVKIAAGDLIAVPPEESDKPSE